MEPMTENAFETALVVVEPLRAFIVHGPDVDHDIARNQDRRVPGTDQIYSKYDGTRGRGGNRVDVANLRWHKSMSV